MPVEKLFLAVRIICLNPPESESNFGLQDKSQNLAYGYRRADGTLEFTCDLEVKKREGAPDFGGSYVHGTPGQRFLYLSLANGSQWVKRIKIPLHGLTPQFIENVASGQVAEATVDGQGAGTVAFVGDGWQVREAN